jgi:hypothetical protein
MCSVRVFRLAVLDRMRSGFVRVQHLSEDCRVCTGYNRALVTLRHPPTSINSTVTTVPLFLATLTPIFLHAQIRWQVNTFGLYLPPVLLFSLIYFKMLSSDVIIKSLIIKWPITVAALSSSARTLESWVRIPLKPWMSVFILCLC